MYLGLRFGLGGERLDLIDHLDNPLCLRFGSVEDHHIEVGEDQRDEVGTQIDLVRTGGLARYRSGDGGGDRDIGAQSSEPIFLPAHRTDRVILGARGGLRGILLLKLEDLFELRGVDVFEEDIPRTAGTGLAAVVDRLDQRHHLIDQARVARDRDGLLPAIERQITAGGRFFGDRGALFRAAGEAPDAVLALGGAQRRIVRVGRGDPLDAVLQKVRQFRLNRSDVLVDGGMLARRFAVWPLIAFQRHS